MDLTFGGGDGSAMVDFAGAGGNAGTDFGRAMAVQTDGKIVLAGHTNVGSVNDQIAIARLNVDGTPDTTFDGDGRAVFYPFGAGTSTIYGVAVQSDGKILVCGDYRAPGSNTADWLLVRFNANGSIDTSFAGGDGVFTMDAGYNYSDTLYALALQTDGKIVATGVATQTTSNFATLRFNTNGTLDNTFDGDGIAIVDYYGGSDYGSDVIIDPDGKIVVAGGAFYPGYYRDFVVLRYTTTGALDSTFGGGDGKINTDFGKSAFRRQILRQPDGKYVVGGLVGGSLNTQNYAMARYNADGSPDPTFNNAGVFAGTIEITALQGYTFGNYGIARQSDGKLLFGGLVDGGSNFDNYLGVVRITTTGQIDTTFASTGYKKYDLPGVTAGTSSGSDVAISTDGKILISGYTFGETVDFGVVKVIPDGTAGGSVTLNGTTLTVTGTASDDALSLQKSGSNFIAILNGTTYTFAAANVASINVSLLGGNDLEFHNGGVPGGSVDLGDGNDTLTSNTGNLAQVLSVLGGAGNDLVTSEVASFTSIAFDAGAGTADKFIFNGSQGNDTPINLSNSLVDINGYDACAFTNVEDLLVNGNFGYDTFNVTGTLTGMEVTISGGDGDDTITFRNDQYPDNFQALTFVYGDGGNDTIIFNDSANPYDDTYTLDGWYNRTYLNYVLPDAEFVQLIAGSGANTIKVRPASYSEYTVSGGSPSTAPGDSITVDLTGASGITFTPTGSGSGKYSFSNLKPVNFSGIERNLTLDTTPPTVTSASFDYQSVPTLKLGFSEIVSNSVDLADLTVVNLTTGVKYNPKYVNVNQSVTQTQTDWGLTFGTQLPDGNYRATLAAGSVQDAAGNVLAAAFVFDFYVLAGDANRDRKVDLLDLYIVSANWRGTGKTFGSGDFNIDGVTDAKDLGILSKNWQKSLAAAPPPAAPAASPVRTPRRTARRIITLLG